MTMDLFSASSFGLAGFLYAVLQIFLTAHILLHKEDVKSAIGWMGLVWLAPLLGSIFYILFGINRIRRKALSLRNRGPDIFTLTGKTEEEIAREIPVPFLQMLRLGYRVHPQRFSLENFIEPYVNGDEAYPEMCRLIASAKKEVLLQSYIFNNDAAGKKFLQAIRQAVQNGASVRVLVDGVGLNYSRPNIISGLKKIKGLHYAVFLPSKSPFNIPFVNLRNHRKILIIDGHTAFFGGMNIAQGNIIQSLPKEPIADITFKVEGPVTDQMARVFEEDWLFASKKRFHAVEFPTDKPLKSHTPARIIPDGPDSDYGKIELLVLGALSCAQKHITIVTPYFLPENNILTALEVAAMRGVKVEIILPSKSNIFGMDWAMRANFLRLLSKDIKIYRTQPPFDHSKILVIDDAWVLFGSANWDVRSFKLNFECVLECISPSLAQKINKIIEHKKKNAFMEKKELLEKQSLCKRIYSNAFKLLTPYY